MKKIFLTKIICMFSMIVFSQKSPSKEMVLNKKMPVLELEASCGTCMFKMKGETCMLAVKLNDKTYFVEGTGIDDHGDAHDNTGFCNAIRKAKVQGKVKNDIFKATYFALLKDSIPVVAEPQKQLP